MTSQRQSSTLIRVSRDFERQLKELQRYLEELGLEQAIDKVRKGKEKRINLKVTLVSITDLLADLLREENFLEELKKRIKKDPLKYLRI